MTHEIIQATRHLRRDWVFTLTAVSILAICIAANTSVFTLIEAILLKPLPYRQAAELVTLQVGLPDVIPGKFPFSASDVKQFRERTRAFSEVAASVGSNFDLSGAVEPMRVYGNRVEAQAWAMVGVAPLLGRLFDEEQERRDERVVVLSHATWKTLFGGDAGMIGKTIDINRRPYTVAAVMPPGFVYPPTGTESGVKRAAIWVPMSFTAQERASLGDNFSYRVIARRLAGVDDARMQEDLARLGAEIKATYPSGFPGKTLVFDSTPLLEIVTGNLGNLFLLLGASVLSVLLIGCANIGSLLLAKAVGRREEYAVRKALGATAWDLVRGSLVEGLLIAIPATALGLLAGAWAVEVLVRVAPESLPRIEEAAIDWRVGLFAIATSLAATLLFSIAPAWHASRTDPGAVQGGNKGGSQSRAALRMGGLLVSGEVALCLVLLGATGLLVQTYWNLLHTNPGFRPERLLAFEVSPPTAVYGDPPAFSRFFARLDPMLAAIPGVKSMSYSDSAPLAGTSQRIFMMEGQTTMSAKAPQMTYHALASPGHFENLGIAILAGRGFGPGDREGQLPVCVINETFAKRFFPRGNALGSRLKYGGPNSKEVPLTIVGIAADTKQTGLAEEPLLQSYQPILQLPSRSRQYFLRTEQAAEAVGASVRQAVRGIDRNQVVGDLRTMQQVIERDSASRKFQMLLLSVFGGAALLLAVTGIFGVIANLVTRRTHEIGIRMALGARPSQTLALVMRGALAPVGLGIVLGLAGLWAAGTSLKSFLYQVEPGNPIVLAGAVGVMILAAMIAVLLPARRAVQVNPAIALRGE